MNSSAINNRSGHINSFTINLIIAVVFTAFLFFIDEGYYDFSWTTHLWNWVFFVVYVLTFVLMQIITRKLILKNYKGSNKTLLTNFIAIPVGLSVLFAIAFVLKAFM